MKKKNQQVIKTLFYSLPDNDMHLNGHKLGFMDGPTCRYCFVF